MTLGATGRSESAIIEVAMAQAVQPGSDGLIAAAAALRLLATSEAASLQMMCGRAADVRSVDLWRALAARLDRSAWFQAAGPEAKPLYDAAMDRLLHTGGPTLRDVVNEIAALPAPAAVASVVDFVCGFFDSLETAEMVKPFITLVGEVAEQRLRAHLARPARSR